MKRLLIKLDPQVARWLSKSARERRRSVSELAGEKLRSCMYRERVIRGFPHLAIKPFNFQWIGGRRPEREELYDRPRRFYKRTNSED